MTDQPARGKRVRAGVSVVRLDNGDVEVELWQPDHPPGAEPERVVSFTAQEWVDMYTYASKHGRDHETLNVELVRIEIARIHDGRE